MSMSPSSAATAADVAAAPAAAAPPPQVPAPAPAIATSGLSKRYRGGQLAVDGLDLRVPQGSVFGFLGPNGSGKTTTIRMLLGLISPTSGGAELLGERVDAARVRTLTRVGALIEGPAHYPYLTGRANLARYDAADRTADPATRAARIDRALEQVGLGNAAEKKAKAYSLGMKQRLGLACALLQPRDLLILDEPTNGLDPQGMREIRTLITSLAAQGTTIFLSSHLLDEIEQVCTDVAIMSRGRLVSQGTVAGLREGLKARLGVTTPDPGDGRERADRARRGGCPDRRRSRGLRCGAGARTGRGVRRAGRRGCAGAVFRSAAAVVGGRVRGVDRGGIRCRSVRRRCCPGRRAPARTWAYPRTRAARYATGLGVRADRWPGTSWR